MNSEPLKAGMSAAADFEIDLRYLQEIASGNNDFIIEVIDLFLEQAPESMTEISARVQTREWKIAGSLAHRLKPTYAMIGVMAGSKLAERIEKSTRGEFELDNLPNLVAELQSISEQAMNKLLIVRQQLVRQNPGHGLAQAQAS